MKYDKLKPVKTSERIRGPDGVDEADIIGEMDGQRKMVCKPFSQSR